MSKKYQMWQKCWDYSITRPSIHMLSNNIWLSHQSIPSELSIEFRMQKSEKKKCQKYDLCEWYQNLVKNWTTPALFCVSQIHCHGLNLEFLGTCYTLSLLMITNILPTRFSAPKEGEFILSKILVKSTDMQVPGASSLELWLRTCLIWTSITWHHFTLTRTEWCWNISP